MKQRFYSTIKYLRTHKKVRYVSLGALTLLLALVLILVKPPSPEVTTQREVITYSTDTPGEEKPTDYVWKGLPGDPKQISLPTIGASGYVQQVGVDQNKAVAVPNNIHLAGWFVDMVVPGSQGLSVIAGHVNGRKNDGIFKDLSKLKPGDSFAVTYGDDSVKTFIVEELQTVDTVGSEAVLFSQKPSIGKQLNLITCGGNFDRAKQQYDKRVIAIAKLKE